MQKFKAEKEKEKKKRRNLLVRTESSNHRITEWLRLEETLKDL